MVLYLLKGVVKSCWSKNTNVLMCQVKYLSHWPFFFFVLGKIKWQRDQKVDRKKMEGHTQKTNMFHHRWVHRGWWTILEFDKHRAKWQWVGDVLGERLPLKKKRKKSISSWKEHWLCGSVRLDNYMSGANGTAPLLITRRILLKLQHSKGTLKWKKLSHRHTRAILKQPNPLTLISLASLAALRRQTKMEG